MLKSKSETKNILILMSGSIAAYKTCYLISLLKQKNYNVKVAMSSAAQKFIGSTTIEGLTGETVGTDLYSTGEAMNHIHWVRWADLILVAPATANTINKLAHGIGDDLISTLFLAHDFTKSFLIAPAMNTKMYLHPTTQTSIATLKNFGCEILETASGVLACGEVGYGRLLEPELLFNEIENRLNSSKTTSIPNNTPALKKSINVLITSGGTQEPIDDVRLITNKSSGKTAAAIADSLISAGFDVTYLHAKSAAVPILDCQKISFLTFTDLKEHLNQQMKNPWTAVIHAAAVSDYSVDASMGKISSQNETLTLTLKRNPKLIDQIKKQQPNCCLIGFKLTSTSDQKIIDEKVSSLFHQSNCDFVVHNDWQQIQNGTHRFNFYQKQKIKIENLDLENLQNELVQVISQKGFQS